MGPRTRITLLAGTDLVAALDREASRRGISRQTLMRDSLSNLVGIPNEIARTHRATEGSRHGFEKINARRQAEAAERRERESR